MNDKGPWWVYSISLAVFLGFILIAYMIDVKDYVNDSIFMILVLSFLFWNYKSFKFTPWVFFSIVFAFALHNMGVYGYYNISPVGLQWDHVTHFFGEFAAGVFVYNFFFAKGFFSKLNGKMERFNVYLFVLLAALGIGVLVEFMEFFGYLVMGDGLGIFGHGLGDINTEFINSEWFNTMFDLVYNFVGALVGVLFCKFVLRDRYLKKRKCPT